MEWSQGSANGRHGAEMWQGNGVSAPKSRWARWRPLGRRSVLGGNAGDRARGASVVAQECSAILTREGWRR